MKKIIISWILVMGILTLGKYTPVNEQADVMDFLTGMAAGVVGVILGVWR